MSGIELTNSEGIQGKIHTIRGVQVMLDNDLAELYHVEVKNLNRAVKRNFERFPPEFMFQLTYEEQNFLRCQFGTSNKRGETWEKMVRVFKDGDWGCGDVGEIERDCVIS